MADWTNLKDSIKSTIKQNGNQEITGALLQSTLLSTVDNVNNDKLDVANVVQSTGTATNKVMSQNAVTKELATKLDVANVVQSTGTATNKVMSQAAASNELDRIKSRINSSSVALGTKSVELFGFFGYLRPTGTISKEGANSQWRTTDFIAVFTGEKFIVDINGLNTSIAIIGCYDSNYNFLADKSLIQASFSGIFTVPDGVSYVIFSGSLDSTIACSGNAVINIVNSVGLNAINLKATNLELSGLYTKFDSKHTGQLDLIKASAKTFGYINKTSGKIINIYDTNWITTDYISVKPGVSFNVSLESSTNCTVISCYNASKKYMPQSSIVGQNPYNGIFSVPKGIDYIRISCNFTKSTATINKIEKIESTDYEYATIDPTTGDLVEDSSKMWKTTPFLHWYSCIGGNYIWWATLKGLSDSSVLIAFYDDDYKLKKTITGTSFTDQLLVQGTYVRISSYGDGTSTISTSAASCFIHLGAEEFVALNARCDDIKAIVDDVKINNVNAYKDVIFCDGDSLTWGDLGSSALPEAEHNYPAVLQSLLGKAYLVKNCGIPAAPSATIVANATGYRTREAFTIPAEAGGSVIFKCSMLRSIDGVSSWTFTPMHSHHNSYGMENPCWINGVKGFIDYTKKEGDTEYSAIFKRTDAGSEVKVEIDDLVLTNEVVFKDKGTHIIYMGVNGGYTKSSTIESINELAGQTDNIISVSSDLYIVMSHCGWGSNSEPWAGESVFEEKYGDHYLNLRKYYSESGIADALERGYLVNEDPDNPTYPTAEDTARMNEGKMPPSLQVSDGVHYNDVGYHLLGDLVFKKYKELYKAKVLGTLN